MEIYAYIGTYPRYIAELLTKHYKQLVITGIDENNKADLGISTKYNDRIIAAFQRKVELNTL